MKMTPNDFKALRRQGLHPLTPACLRMLNAVLKLHLATGRGCRLQDVRASLGVTGVGRHAKTLLTLKEAGLVDFVPRGGGSIVPRFRAYGVLLTAVKEKP